MADGGCRGPGGLLFSEAEVGFAEQADSSHRAPAPGPAGENRLVLRCPGLAGPGHGARGWLSQTPLHEEAAWKDRAFPPPLLFQKGTPCGCSPAPPRPSECRTHGVFLSGARRCLFVGREELGRTEGCPICG